MKKYIPYIFITAFIGAFLTLSFAGSFSGNILGPKIAEAQAPTVTGDQAGPTVANDTSTTEPWYKTTGRWAGYAIGYGTYWGKGSLTDNPIGHIISMILELFFYMTSKLLALSAILLDTVIQFTVTNFKTNIEGMGVIDTGYAIILNLANMIFIFILL